MILLLHATLLCMQIDGPQDIPGLQEKNRSPINSKSKSAFRSRTTWENILIEATVVHFLILLIHQEFLSWAQCWVQEI